MFTTASRSPRIRSAWRCSVIAGLGLLVIGPAQAADNTTGSLSGASPTYDRIVTSDVDPNCNATSFDSFADGVFYDVIPIFTTVPENLECSLVGAGTTIGDTVISLHCDFDPALPADSLVAFDDDGGGGLLSAFTAGDGISLDSLRSYDLVLSTFSAGAMGNYEIAFSGHVHAGADTVSGVLGVLDPFYDRIFGSDVDLNCNATSLDSSNNGMHYEVIPIFTPAPDLFTCEVLAGGTTIVDTVLSLHCDFDPVSPELSLVAYDDDGGSGLLSAFTPADNIMLEPLRRYDLVVSTFFGGVTGSYQIALGGNSQVGTGVIPGEDCASIPFPASTSFMDQGDTFGAVDDLDIDASMAGCFPVAFAGTGLGPEVVYEFNTPFGGMVDVSMLPLALVDLAVYAVTDCSDLEGTCVGGDDNGVSGSQEDFSFAASPEVSYFIIVDGFAGAAGPFNLTVDHTPPQADLAVTKENGVDEVTQGQSLLYTVVVTNGGPDTALNIPVDDVSIGLDNVMWIAQASPGSSVDDVAGSGEIHTQVDLLTGGAVTFEISAQVPISAIPFVVNSAQVGDTGDDPNLFDNVAEDVDVVLSPDLVITKTVDPVRVHADQEMRFFFTMANLGSSEATGVAVGDTLEPGVVYLSDTCGGSVSGDQWRWDIGTLPAGEMVSCEITATVLSCCVYGNVATVELDQADRSPITNRAEVTFNQGFNILRDPSFERGQASPFWRGGSPTLGNPASAPIVPNAPRTGSFNLLFIESASAEQTVVIPISSEACLKLYVQNLAPGASPEDIIRVLIDGAEILAVTNGDPAFVGAYRPISADLSAFADGAPHDIRIESEFNNAPFDTWIAVDDVTLAVCPQYVDLRITKTESQDPVLAGQPLLYTLDLDSLGPGVAHDTVVTDTLPPDVTFLSASSSQGSWEVSGGIVSFELGIVPPPPPMQGIIVNGDFETGDLTGWAVEITPPPPSTQEFFPSGVYEEGNGSTGFFPPSQPVDGIFSYINGFDGSGPFTYDIHQEVTIPLNATSADLSWAEELQWDLIGFCFGCTRSREYEVTVQPPGGGPPLATLFAEAAAVGTSRIGSGEVAHVVDLLSLGPISAGDTIRLNWHLLIPEVFTGPAQFELDAVALDVVPPPPPNQTVATMTIEVEVDPTLAGGTLINTAEALTSTLDLDPASNVAVASTEVIAPQVTATPPSVDFGRRDIDDDPPLTRALTIGNAGTAPLMFTGAEVAIAGPGSAEMAITADSGQPILSPSASRVLTIEFDPVTLGDKTSILVITSDDPDEPVFEVPLIAEGVQFGPTGHTTGDIVAYLLGLLTGPLAEFDVNTDTIVDAADVVENVEAINNP